MLLVRTEKAKNPRVASPSFLCRGDDLTKERKKDSGRVVSLYCFGPMMSQEQINALGKMSNAHGQIYKLPNFGYGNVPVFLFSTTFSEPTINWDISKKLTTLK